MEAGFIDERLELMSRGRMVFLLEESSMEKLLNGLLPRIFPEWKEGVNFLLVTHEGKSDLRDSIPRKLKNWRIQGDRFVVLMDNDSKDCIITKQELSQICHKHGRPDTLIRLVCQELESWYLGDLLALARAYNDLGINSPKNQKRYKCPDEVIKPSVHLKNIVPSFQKGNTAQRMGALLEIDQNKSKSFQAFVLGLTRIANEMDKTNTERRT